MVSWSTAGLLRQAAGGVSWIAQVKDGALGGVTGASSSVFDDMPVALPRAVFVAGVMAQKQVVGRQSITVAQPRGRGPVSTCGMGKIRGLPLSELRHARGQKMKTASPP